MPQNTADRSVRAIDYLTCGISGERIVASAAGLRQTPRTAPGSARLHQKSKIFAARYLAPLYFCTGGLCVGVSLMSRARCAYFRIGRSRIHRDPEAQEDAVPLGWQRSL